MNWLLWLLALALAGYSVWGVGTATVKAGADAQRTSRAAWRAADEGVSDDEWKQIQADARTGTLKQVGAIGEADLSAQTIWSPGADKNPVVIGFTDGMSLVQIAVAADEDTRQKKAASKGMWVVWMDERMGWQPLRTSTVGEYEAAKARAYEMSAKGAAPVPKYTIVFGPTDTREQVLDKAAADLDEVRRLPGGPGAVYGGMLVGNVGPVTHNIESLPIPAEKLRWAQGQGP
ncbi:MAG TPA: hypothetical protein VF902_06405 [Coriobacteriia bacterium]